jgi:thiol-disulfide isomerase/thioredoxin
MPYLFVFTAAVAVLTVFDLVLTMGVVRRLRSHTELLDRLTTGGLARKLIVEPGQAPADASATTVDGALVTTADLGDTLVGFFSPTCTPCAERAPQFVEYARRLPGGRSRAVAVVVSGTEGAPDALTALFEPVARVVVEPPEGPLATAFQVVGFPALCLLDSTGTVRASGTDLAGFPVAATV